MSRKSYVNARLRAAVRPRVKMMRPYVLGQKALDTARAWLDRSYVRVCSGLAFMADDFTMPVYFHIPDGQGWFQLVRGQVLLAIDFRTLRILGFSLQPDRNYSAPVIHTLFTRVFTDFGVPSILYLERGIWESSRLITGGIRAQRVAANWQHMPLSVPEVSRGFGDLGVHFIHAHRARSKPVERVGGLLQDLMEREPGYCGRDERRDCPATTKQQMDAVKYHRVDHPSVHFYSQEQWAARLLEIVAAYNATPQEGKLLAGLSPDDAFEQLQDPARAPQDFDFCRHLLAHYRIPVTVGSLSRDNFRSNGITIRFSGKTYVYRNEQTGRDKFTRKLAWFNPEEPSILAVTDLAMRNPYSVPLSNSVDALQPDPDSYATEVARIEAHESFGKALYRTCKAKFDPFLRRVIPDRATFETGEQIREQRESIEAGRRQGDTRKRKVQTRAGALGLPASIVNTDAPGEEGTAMMQQARQAHRKKQKGATSEGDKPL